MESEIPEVPKPTSTGWSECSMDVLMLIFQRLPVEDLFHCMSVNRWWRIVVDYTAQHDGRWSELAKIAMVNKGITFKRKSKLGWRELYMNSRLWTHLASANLEWKYVTAVEDIQFVHLYKDNLIVVNKPEYSMRVYKINGPELPEVIIPMDQFEEPLAKNTDYNSSGREASLDERTNWVKNDSKHYIAALRVIHNNHTPLNLISVEDEEMITKKMIEKLVHEGPFKKLLVIEDGYYYTLDKANVIRHFKWNPSEGNWLNLTLARYYGCNTSISDIHVSNDDVFLLRKCGTVMRLDREGRNFVSGFRFDMPYTLHDYVQLMRGDLRLRQRLEKLCQLPVPEYGTGRQVLFQNYHAIVGVPREEPFKVTVGSDGHHRVIECPGLTCATQHGEVLFLGYDDGKVDICRSDSFIESQGAAEIQVNVQDYQRYVDSDPSIVALDVYEDEMSHLLYIATNSSIYKLIIKYPEEVKQSLGFV